MPYCCACTKFEFDPKKGHYVFSEFDGFGYCDLIKEIVSKTYGCDEFEN